MKKFLSGLIIGLLLASAMPIKAAIDEYVCYKADYKLVINGVEYTDPDLPLMNYKGYTVGSVRKILEASGMALNWNAELGQAEVMQTGVNTSVKSNEPKYYAFIKSDVFKVGGQCDTNSTRYILKDGNIYLPLVVFALYLDETQAPKAYKATIGEKTATAILDDKIGGFVINISELGLAGRLEGATLWLDKTP